MKINISRVRDEKKRESIEKMVKDINRKLKRGLDVMSPKLKPLPMDDIYRDIGNIIKNKVEYLGRGLKKEGKKCNTN